VGLIVALSVGGGLLLLGLVVALALLLAWPAGDEPEPFAWHTPVNPVPVVPPVLQPPPLPDFGPPPAVPVDADPIARAVADLRSDDVFRQADAARALQRTPVNPRRQPEVIAALKGVVENRRPLVPRQEAARTLGVWGTRADVPYLLGLLDDSDHGVQAVAIVGLGRLKDARAADLLALRLKNGGQRAVASQALKELGPAAEAAVRQQLDSPDNPVRVEACKILKVIGTRASYPALVRAARDPDHGVADAAREALPPALRPPVYGSRQTITLNVHVANIQAWPALEAKIKALADDPDLVYSVHTSGDYKWVKLAPVNCDAETFARRINFGRIVAVHNDQRLIYVDSGR
jgi:hypothetical protein